MIANQPKKLYLIDAFTLVYRAYYAFIHSPRVTSAGLNTSATFGFVLSLAELLETERPAHVAVVFDPGGPNFRHAMFPDYKGHRPPMPEEIRQALPFIRKIIEGLGIASISVAGYEADDVIGTLAGQAEKEGYDVYMITSDKDYAQLVSDHVFMYKPGRGSNGAEITGVAEVLERFGIARVEQVVDILGLTGDASDNVPGCAGIGPKGAAALIKQYGSIEEVYRHVDELKGKQRENLLACRETVLLSRELVTICRSVPVGVTIGELSRGEINRAALETLFRELEFFSLGKRLLDAPRGKEEETPDVATGKQTYLEATTVAEREALLARLLAAPVYGTCTRFERGGVHDALPSLLSFSVSPGEGYFTRLSGEADAEFFRPVFEDAGKTLVSDDAKVVLSWTARAGIATRNKVFDVQVARYVLQPDGPRDLERESPATTGRENDPRQLSLAFEDEEEGSHGRELAGRAATVLRLQGSLRAELERTGLLPLFEEMEMPLVSVLSDMEREGVSIDLKALKEMSAGLRKEIGEMERVIHEMAGREFNINSPKQLGEVLFEEMGVDPGQKKTKRGQYITSEQVLSRLEEVHPIVGRVLDYRGLKKLLTTYVEALPGYVNPATGKIHTCFNQSEAATGRLSSLNPNLQNIPIRAEGGHAIRKAFVTGDPACCFFSADYSQVELRLMAHLSGTRELIDAFLNGEDVHAATAAKIYRVPPREVTPEMRRRAKTANFGIIYGISAWGLAERLRISRKEGKELIDGYFQLYPGVKEYMERSVEMAREKGYAETIMGRRRYLKNILSKNIVERGVAERNAINAPIQGSAADIIKKAMIAIHAEIKGRGMKSRMILQVHDELNFTCHREELEELKQLVTGCMEGVVQLSVPLTVSTGHGENWYEAH
ncbi:MAG: DNA polymerase I [Odoribacteraceae bacterium]|jgi:DNA polymerase-1|nr:DNA polymerase I [Odoribacteraceae bacterium]